MDNATKQQNSSNAREGNGLPAMLTRLRENAGMTQEEASKLFEVNRSTYAYYETGKSHPKSPLLCGEMSNGMLLAGDVGDHDVQVLFVDGMPAGTKIR
jgi:DNA-binding XRE family transcriptional regulator